MLFALQQPIHGLVDVVLVNIFESEFGAERMAGGVRVQGGTSGEFAFGIKDTGSDKGNGEASLFGVFGCDDAMELQSRRQPSTAATFPWGIPLVKRKECWKA